LSTRIRHCARVYTLLVDASSLAGTLRVRATSNLNFSTAGTLGSFKSWWALTVDLMVCNCTLCWSNTGVGYRAGVHTVAVIAGLLSWTVKV
jgi:hypothetical protein